MVTLDTHITILQEQSEVSRFQKFLSLSCLNSPLFLLFLISSVKLDECGVERVEMQRIPISVVLMTLKSYLEESVILLWWQCTV